MKDRIRALLDKNRSRALSTHHIIRKLDLQSRKQLDAMESALHKLVKDGDAEMTRNGQFRTRLKAEIIEGRVDFVNSRYAFIISPDTQQDAMVNANRLKNALDGDIVKVQLYGGAKDPDKRPEGEVIEIVKRGRTQYVGRIQLSKGFAFVIADSRKMHFDIFVKPNDLLTAQDNDKVMVEITQWPDRNRNPEGKVVRVLGPAGENNAEIHSIMAEFDLPFEFPKGVESQARRIKDDITEEEIGRRRDFRHITTFTIDPFDAKDFDDAISLQLLENGNYEVGIHIADVSHYVKPGTMLDKEAIERATSVYLVDRTIPMLPERLSNELCSLRPQEEKLCFSAVFELDKEAVVVNEWFGRTVIYSDRRFTYEEAQERIETLQGDFAREMIILNTLALKLKADRFARGAINFETVEVKFKLDEDGRPLAVIPKVRKDSHKLVEEFMLLANKRVAEWVYKQGKKGRGEYKSPTYVYRIHDSPNPEKLEGFSAFAKKFGHQLNTEEDAVSNSLNKLMLAIQGRPEQNVLETLAIRSMAKAKYSTEPEGHFGLAFEHYTHFTSPIRRYPDVMVHRLLQHYLDGGKSAEQDKYQKLCEHSSDREKRAADAERASIKYKQVEFMKLQDPETIWDGLVSGVTEWGVYVEIVETRCEGMARLADLKDDYYEYDDQNYRIVGKSNKKMITLGDKVKVKVSNTDIDRRTIDLELIEF
ncbi:ribonuclease R [Cesiribacter andamanensis]|uniref:Ribonuclease R n=1 Tax=Cesiribacter andamanensis AMV16 TaxID=1279009 RepID=M7N6Y9_9BACT|nr:ribonuclease R [Cesiribacter andamanensis]EMR03001.1 Ribonuclease R [Cesiribacter andamanensis AMV16]